MASARFPTDAPGTQSADDARLIDLTPDLLAVVHLDGRVRRANRAWAESFPWTAEDFTVETFRAQVHPDDALAFETAQRAVLSGNPAEAVALRVHDGTGYRELEMTAVPDTTEAVFTVHARDLTEVN